MTPKTIVAISTPPGLGGVGIVRLSGQNALSIAKTLFHCHLANPSTRLVPSEWTPSHLYYGNIRNPDSDEIIDDGYAVFFRSPNSFTGEDVIEFQLHANPFVLSNIVELCLKEGARLAEPGEFTKRAYLNGKMDLLQAEAVSEFIHSQSKVEAQKARLRLDGKLSSHLEILREQVIDLLAEIEADVDFPEEDIDPKSQSRMIEQLQSMIETTKQLLATYTQNQKISSGFRIALVGKPNVGKSSLFNAILQMDRAIVTPQPGTTRDVLSEEIILDGYRVKFFDTAGLRDQTSDTIEKEGILRSTQEISKADLIWWIGSASEEHSEKELDAIDDVEKDKRWLIWNKIDSDSPRNNFSSSFEKTFLVSAKTGQGVRDVLNALREKIKSSETNDFGGGISNDRQKEILGKTLHFLSRTNSMILEKQPPELTAVEFRQSFHALNQLLGKEENMEAVYDRIFSKFCVGK